MRFSDKVFYKDSAYYYIFFPYFSLKDYSKNEYQNEQHSEKIFKRIKAYSIAL